MAEKMIQCPACEKEISRKATQCPSCGHKIKKPFYKDWRSLLVLGVAVIIFSAVASGGRNKQNDKVATKVGSVQSTNASATQEAEPSNVFHVGDILRTDDFSITYQECDTDWKGYNNYLGPKDGKKVVRAYFVFENIGDRDHSCGSLDFDCYADGVACDSFFWSSDDSLSYASLSPGRKLQGYIAYEVPVGAEEIELEYETSFWSQKKVIFAVE